MSYAGEYLKPPRPEGKVPPATLKDFERKRWFAQYKKNGTNSATRAAG